MLDEAELKEMLARFRREDADRDAARGLYEVPQSDGSTSLPGASLARYSYPGFRELLASGDLRGLALRPDGDYGFVFTLKALLSLRHGSAGVYMHGFVEDAAVLESLLDRLVLAGRWHRDKYWKPS